MAGRSSEREREKGGKRDRKGEKDSHPLGRTTRHYQVIMEIENARMRDVRMLSPLKPTPEFTKIVPHEQN